MNNFIISIKNNKQLLQSNFLLLSSYFSRNAELLSLQPVYKMDRVLVKSKRFIQG